MLAAINDDRDRAPLLRLALLLVSSRSDKEIPESLKSYVLRIVSEAFRLARDPSTQKADTNPEAIELALGIRAREALARELEHLNDFSRVSPELADKLLEQLGAASVRRD